MPLLKSGARGTHTKDSVYLYTHYDNFLWVAVLCLALTKSYLMMVISCLEEEEPILSNIKVHQQRTFHE